MKELELLNRLAAIRDETTDTKTELSINALIIDRWGNRSQEALELREEREALKRQEEQACNCANQSSLCTPCAAAINRMEQDRKD